MVLPEIPLSDINTCQAELRLGLCLEALRPSEELTTVPWEEVAQLLNKADFKTTHLRPAIERLLMEGQRGRAIGETKRRVRKDEKIGTEKIREELERARKELHDLFKENNWNIKTPHCLKAWAKFYNWLNPVIHPLFPDEKDWDPTEKRALLQKITERHTSIANQGEAKYHDRRRMDNRAEQFQKLALKVNSLMRACLDSERKNDPGDDNVSLLRQSLAPLLKEDNPVVPSEDFEWRLLQAVFSPLNQGQKSSRTSKYFTADDVFTHPRLLAFLSNDTDWSEKPGEVFVGMDEMLACAGKTSNLACRLSVAWSEDCCKELQITSRPGLEAHLRQNRYHELLARLPHLSDDGQAVLEQWKRDAQSCIDNCRDRLEKAGALMASLAMPEADQVDRFAETAGNILHWEEDARTIKDSSDLVYDLSIRFGISRESIVAIGMEWLTKASEWAESVLHENIENLKQFGGSELPEDERGRFRSFIEKKELANALLLLRREKSEGEGEQRHRETHWRRDAETLFGDPDASLSKIRREKVSDELKAAIISWRGVAAANKLRESFGKWIFPNLPKKESELKDVYRCSMERVTRTLEARNPCFLPQVSQFEYIAIVAPSTRASETRFKQDVINLLSSRLLNEDGGKYLVAVLAPHCTAQTRMETLSELRQFKGIAVGLIDDIDFCRLIRRDNNDIDPRIGLLEILLEQRRELDTLSPYRPTEGQNVKVEMYVGRKEQASALARNDQYSRLFSGRKLGKSALLKYTQYLCENKNFRLPSGNRLHVIYILGNAMNSEMEAVREILLGIHRHFMGMPKTDGYYVAPPDMPAPGDIEGTGEDPGKYLEKRLADFLDTNPEASLIIVIDEADLFVETQLKEYASRKEMCLSFIMGRNIVQYKDTKGLPRIRFLFSGYRVTSTREGVWRNWGDLLQLAPLEKNDAMQLVAGPFARLGIDMARHTAMVAWRCGYQPAVIMKFGEVFLKQKFGQNREYYSPEHDDIEQVLSSREVKQEIHGIVQGNFQGRPELRLVFEAFLIEANEQAFRMAWLDEASYKIANRISSLSNGSAAEFGTDKVSELLEELHARSLLEKTRGDRFRLLHPHHLPILCPMSGNEALRKLYQSEIRGTPSEDGIDWRGCEMLQRTAIDDINFSLRNPLPEHGNRAVTVAGEWPAILDNQETGFIARAGIPYEKCFQSISVEEAESILSRMTPDDDTAVLFTGGSELLRWSIPRRRDDLLVCGLGRLSREQTIWWFCHTHLWGFETKHGEKIHAATAGIPRLLKIFEDICLEKAKSGHDQSGNEAELGLCLEAILEEFSGHAEKSIVNLANQKDGTLLERECDLMNIVAWMACEFDPKADQFVDVIPLYEPKCFSGRQRIPRPVSLDGVEDKDSLLFLAEMGLIPAMKGPILFVDRLVLPDRDDPIIRYWPKD